MFTLSTLGADTVYVSKDGTRIARVDRGAPMHGTPTLTYMPLNGYKIHKRDGAINLPKPLFVDIKKMMGLS